MTREEYGKSYERGFTLTVRFLVWRGVNAEAAEETAQTAWARGWERRAQLRDERQVVSWVNAIAWNVYRGLMRRPSTEELTDFPVLPQVNLDAIDVVRVLRSCKPHERLVLEQHYLQDIGIAELAQLRGWTSSGARIRLFRARRSARAWLNDADADFQAKTALRQVI